MSELTGQTSSSTGKELAQRNEDGSSQQNRSLYSLNLGQVETIAAVLQLPKWNSGKPLACRRRFHPVWSQHWPFCPAFAVAVGLGANVQGDGQKPIQPSTTHFSANPIFFPTGINSLFAGSYGHPEANPRRRLDQASDRSISEGGSAQT